MPERLKLALGVFGFLALVILLGLISEPEAEEEKPTIRAVRTERPAPAQLGAVPEKEEPVQKPSKPEKRSKPAAAITSRKRSSMERQVSELLDASWEVRSVRLDDVGVLNVSVSLRRIPEGMYLAVIPSICHLLQKEGSLQHVSEIRILNQFNREGYVFENPGTCSAVLSARRSNVKNTILSNTHLFRP